MASFTALQKRVDELENELTKLAIAKSAKALAKFVTPQPIKSHEQFNTYDAESIFFKQLLKIHDANQKVDFDFARAFGTDEKPDMSTLYKPLGELIIFATTYLERIGCDADARQKLFAELNRKFEE